MTDKAKYPSQIAERFQIRMPDGLRDDLRSAAADNNRSMNAEIVDRLERSFEFDQDVARDDEIFVQMQQDQRFLKNELSKLEETNTALLNYLSQVTGESDTLQKQKYSAEKMARDYAALVMKLENDHAQSLRPQAVTLEIAAQYCAVSPEEFSQFVKVSPFKIGHEYRYDLAEIDKYIDGLPRVNPDTDRQSEPD